MIVTNGFGSVTSAVAVLTLLQAPTFTATSEPFDRAPACHDLQRHRDRAGALTYQWQFNGADILDATNTTTRLLR